MFKRLIVSTVLAAAALAIPATPASAAAACTYRQTGSTWQCVTPGAYCPAAAHNRAGKDKYAGRVYHCKRYSNGQWRWRRG